MLQSTHANVDFKVNLKRIHKTLFVLSFEKCVYSSTSDVFSIMLVISKKGGGVPPRSICLRIQGSISFPHKVTCFRELS